MIIVNTSKDANGGIPERRRTKVSDSFMVAAMLALSCLCVVRSVVAARCGCVYIGTLDGWMWDFS